MDIEYIKEKTDNAILFDQEHGYSGKIIACLDQCHAAFQSEWGAFDRKWNTHVRSALDIASGSGLFAYDYAMHFRNKGPNGKSSLNWFPSESPSSESDATGKCSRNPLMELKVCLSTWQKSFVARSPREDVLFPDKNGRAVYPNDKVNLDGLKNQASLNGALATVQRIATGKGSEGRVVVKLKGKDPIAIKANNLILNMEGCLYGDFSKLGTKEIPPSERIFLKDLSFEEAKIIDESLVCIDNLTSWALSVDVSDMKGYSWEVTCRRAGMAKACPLVTCSYLLTTVGEHQPDIWKNVLFVATEFLAVGGYLVMFDTVAYGGYGDEDVMRKCGREHPPHPMTLVEVETLGEHDGNAMVVTVWRKAGSVAEEIGSLESVWAMSGKKPPRL